MLITRAAQQDIVSLTDKQKNTLRKALTFKNPAYAAAKKYGKSRYISIPKELVFYSEKSQRVREGERQKVFSVPGMFNVAETLKLDETGLNIVHQQVSCPVKFPPFALTLRADQKAAADAYFHEIFIGAEYPKSLIQMPTGKGKTILALYLAKTLGERTLVLVHKDDLVTGWQKDIQLCFPGMKPGLIKAKSRKVGEQVTIATVQTLSRMDDEEREKYLTQFGFVVQDECHHIGLNMFNIIGQFPAKYKLGLTATPKRADGLSLVFDLFLGGLCYTHVVKEDDEDISQVEVRLLHSQYHYKPFVFDGQVFNVHDFKPEDLPEKFEYLDEIPYDRRPSVPYLTIDNAAVTAEDTSRVVIERILREYGQGHSILVMFNQKEHIRLYRDLLCETIPEEQVLLLYGDNREDFDSIRRRAESKEALITLATYAKATEGTNVKAWEVLFMVSSKNNEKDIEQATGRIRRRKEGKLDPVRVYVVCYQGCYSLRSHLDTYLKVFKDLKYKMDFTDPRFPRPTAAIFSRGYR